MNDPTVSFWVGIFPIAWVLVLADRDSSALDALRVRN